MKTITKIDVTSGLSVVRPMTAKEEAELPAEALLPVVSDKQREILTLESQQRAKMTERADREFRVGVMEAIAALQSQVTGVPLPTLLAQMVSKNKGYREMKDLDDQIAALRSQL